MNTVDEFEIGRPIESIIPLSEGDWESLDIDESFKLYWLLKPDCGGFTAYYIEWAASFDSIDYYEVIFVAYAAFDGVRHIYFGEYDGDLKGYINYPNLVNIIAGLKELRDLEKSYCNTDFIREGIKCD